MLAQRLIFPAHSISNKLKSLEVFLKCTNGLASAHHSTWYKMELVLLVINLELTLKKSRGEVGLNIFF